MLLLPVVFALAAPPSFVQAVKARLADAPPMHVVDWWADDLDGDHVPESIAFVCGDDAGMFLVQHGNDLLEAPAQVDGRNSCPEAPSNPPAWRVAKAGVIRENYNVHHGGIGYWFAIRAGQLVLVREDGDGIDVGPDGITKEANRVDYDNLTWSQRVQPPHQRATQTSGPLVVITDRVRRASKLVGESTLAATRGDHSTTLHIHADRALVVRDCSDKPCEMIRIAKGDREVAIAAPGDLEILAGKAKIVVHFEALEGEASYPPPPRASH
jgi:hypothetical protein